MLSAINVTTPDGRCGPWAIQTFEVDPHGAAMFNARLARKGTDPAFFVVPGKYKRLIHDKRGTVMSNTPMEVWTNSDFIKAAKGVVLINGLGLGMVLHAIMDKAEVTRVVVVERELDVIALTAPHFRDHLASGRLTIVHADAFKHRPPRGEKYDVVWHDIWDTISDENTYEMLKLRLKYAKRAKLQLCWAEDECKKMHQTLVLLCEAAGQDYEKVRIEMKDKGLL